MLHLTVFLFKIMSNYCSDSHCPPLILTIHDVKCFQTGCMLYSQISFKSLVFLEQRSGKYVLHRWCGFCVQFDLWTRESISSSQADTPRYFGLRHTRTIEDLWMCGWYKRYFGYNSFIQCIIEIVIHSFVRIWISISVGRRIWRQFSENTREVLEPHHTSRWKYDLELSGMK